MSFYNQIVIQAANLAKSNAANKAVTQVLNENFKGVGDQLYADLTAYCATEEKATFDILVDLVKLHIEHES
jgi:hypothetical protein